MNFLATFFHLSLRIITITNQGKFQESGVFFIFLPGTFFFLFPGNLLNYRMENDYPEKSHAKRYDGAENYPDSRVCQGYP